MDLYERWLATPWREMPWWLNWLLGLVYLVGGYIVSQSVGSDSGTRLLVFVPVAVSIRVGIGIVWRATHREAGG